MLLFECNVVVNFLLDHQLSYGSKAQNYQYLKIVVRGIKKKIYI